MGPTTDEEWSIHSLNIHGSFFERWCQQIVSESGIWGVSRTNVPVAFPLDGGKESELDVQAELSYPGRHTTLLIECKKNNPDFVNWIFFRKRSPGCHPSNLPFIMQHMDVVPESGTWRVDRSYHSSYTPFIVTSDARETRGSYQGVRSGDKTRTSNAAVTEAARQITLATHAVAATEHQRCLFHTQHAQRPEMGEGSRFFLPMIVTTAQLFVCEFDPARVDSATGELPYAGAALSEQPVLVYEYPIPTSLQIDPRTLAVHPLSPGARTKIEWLERMQIVVVNSNHFAKVLRRIPDDMNLR
jgi:hypothetical protein